MSNRPNRRHTRRAGNPEPPWHITPEIERYAAMLEATGMPEREVARAAVYAGTFGLDAMSPPDGADCCVVFDTPSCSDWNCLNPHHQVLTFPPTGTSEFAPLDKLVK